MAKSSLTEIQKNRAFELHQEGYSQAKIAGLMDVSQGTISRVVKEKGYEQIINEKDKKLEDIAIKGMAAAQFMAENIKWQESRGDWHSTTVDVDNTRRSQQKQIEHQPICRIED